MPEHNPRNRNLRTKEAPKSTAVWFDERKSEPKRPCGFHIPEKDER